MKAGYSGYVPGFRVVPPASAPGSSNNTVKFQSAGKSVVYDSVPLLSKMNESRASVTSDASVFLDTKCYAPPDPRGVMAEKQDRIREEALKRPRRFTHKSAKATEFPDYWRQRSQVTERPTEDYRVTFDRYAVNGLLTVVDCLRVFSEVHGSSMPMNYSMLLEEKLHNELQGQAQSRPLSTSLSAGLRAGLAEVTWDMFAAALAAQREQLRAVKIGPSEPSALYEAKLDPRVVTDLTEPSRYSTDLGRQGDIPSDRGLMTNYGGMASTTNDLMQGTAKLSNQIPGYSGHIPKAGGRPTLQPEREDHKRSVKDVFCPNIPGYTGHFPTYGLHAKTTGVEITTRTTTGGSQALAAALATGTDWKMAM